MKDNINIKVNSEDLKKSNIEIQQITKNLEKLLDVKSQIDYPRLKLHELAGLKEVADTFQSENVKHLCVTVLCQMLNSTNEFDKQIQIIKQLNFLASL